MPFFTDQLNRTIELPSTPKRIVSLVPSQTEFLYDLGLYEEVAGITKFCIHPELWFRTKSRIGGTKNIHLDKVHLLKPDLIIANKEENVQNQVETLAAHYPVWVSDVNTLEEGCQMMKMIGALTDRQVKADKLINEILARFEQLPLLQKKYKTAYLIWWEPYMTVGGDTFVHDIMQKAGFYNAFSHKNRYPSVTVEDLQREKLDLLLLSSEPYPYAQKHIEELQSHLPKTVIKLVDGELFSWYGSRLLKAPPYFKTLHKKIKSMV